MSYRVQSSLRPLLLHPLEATFDIGLDLALPKDQNPPAFGPQVLLLTFIPIPIPLELLLPEFLIPLGQPKLAVRTSMPVAAMYEDGKPTTRVAYIWSSRSFLPM